MSRPRSARVHALRRRPRRRLAALLVLSGLLAATWSGAGTAVADEGAAVPARPTGLEVTTQPGSLDVSVDWDDTDGATSYLVRWRQAGFGTSLNDGVTVTASTATITVQSHGDWVVRVEACNNAGCGLGAAERFTVENATPEPTTATPEPTPESEPTTESEPASEATEEASERLAVSITADTASPAVGEKVTLTAAISSPPSESEPSYRWEMMDAGGWFVAGKTETFSYMAESAETWGFRVTVAYGSGESATSEPVTVAWTAPETAEAANRAPVVDEQADNYERFIGSHSAPRGILVSKNFEGIFSDPDGDTLTYTVSVPDDHADLVETLDFYATSDRVGFEYDGDDDWNAADPALPDPLTTEITLTATDPDGLSASLTGRFQADWESHPVLRGVDAHETTMIVVFDHDLQAAPAPLPGQFTVKVFNADGASAGTIAVDSVEVRDRRVFLELASAPEEDDQSLTLDYAHHDDRPLKRAAAGGDSAPGFTGQFVWRVIVGSDPEDGRSNLILATDNPDPSTLVGNTAQTASTVSWSLNTYDIAQAFTTGSHPPGYTLAAVRINLKETPTTGLTYPALSVRICHESSGSTPTQPSTSCLGRRPLLNPAILDSGVKTFIVLASPGTGIHLEPSTTYFVVIDSTAAGTREIGVVGTTSYSEDAGAAAGWSIANTASRRALDSTGTWTEVLGAWQIDVIGFQNYYDYDTDYDGLIEISNDDQLNAIRYDENGNGSIGDATADAGTTENAANQTSYSAAFPHAVPGMGCPNTGCTGYELTRDIDLANRTWTPITNLRATFEGNGHIIENLTIDRGTQQNTSFFVNIRADGEVRNLGLVDVDVRGGNQVAALVVINRGLVVGSYSTGRVSAVNNAHGANVSNVGGLVSWNEGKIHASYSSATVYAAAGGTGDPEVQVIGGLVGTNRAAGEIRASYASGSVTVEGTGTQRIIGGLVGGNDGQIRASYSVGVVTADAHATLVGGLLGNPGGEKVNPTDPDRVTDSYWDLGASGQNPSTGASGGGTGTGKLTAELTGPTGYTGIYANWNVDLDGDGVADNPWRFKAGNYPALSLKLPDIVARPGSVGRQGARLNHRPHAFHTCRENIGIGRTPGDSWRADCSSRALSGHHAFYYTFTLPQETRVRLHVSAHAPARPRLILREGHLELGEGLHQGEPWQGYNTSRIDERLPAGTYTVEVARHGRPGLWFTLSTGTVTPPTASQAGGSNIWEATLTAANPNNSPGCDDRWTGHGCTGALTPNFFVHEGTTYTVRWIIQGTDTLFFTLNQAYPEGFEDWTLNVNGHEFRLVDADINPFGNANVGEARWQGSSANTGLTVGATAQVSLSIGGCSRPIDRGQTRAARWDPECASVSNPGSHAAYYTYTPDRNRGTTLTLTSPDADEKVYLWEGDRLVAERLWSGTSFARLYHSFTAGKTYTIEVTSENASPNGRYLLTVSGDFNPEGAAVARDGECRETLAVDESGRFGASGGGTWEWPCHSVERPGAYARYYTFTLTEERDVRVELYSSQVGSAHMYLRAGTKGSGTHMGESHDPGPGPVDARMDGRLAAGTYTVEVVATTPGRGGDITLAIKEAPAPWTPPAECRTDLSLTLNTNGLWRGGQYAEPCNSAARPGSHSRWYTFTINQRATLNMSLFAHDADAYLYLRAGETYSGLFIAENDNVRPWPGWEAPTAYGFYDSQLITERLDPGTYTIEVTTRSAGETGGFSLGVSARTN